MATVECNECGRNSEDVICIKCYESLKEELGITEEQIADLEQYIADLNCKIETLEDKILNLNNQLESR